VKPHPLRLLQISALLLLGAGFYWPLLSFLSGNNPLHPEESFMQWEFFKEFLSDPWNLRVIGFSLYQAFLSALLSILVGLPGAWLLTNYNFPGKRWFRLLTYLPFILPSILVVLAMVLFYGNNGWINRGLMAILGTDEPQVHFLYSLTGILIAHVFYNFPLAMKIIGDQWERISLKYHHAASSLGVGNMRRFFGITLPLLMPSIGSAFVLIFLLCMNSFAIILVLGGGIRYTTIEVLIYQLARIELDFSGAASLAFLQGGLSLIGMAILLKGRDSRVDQESASKSWLPEKLRNRSMKAWFGLCWILLVLIFALGPLFAILMDSFRKFEHGEWIYTWYWYSELFTWRENNYFLSSLWNSLRIGLGSALISSISWSWVGKYNCLPKRCKEAFLGNADYLPDCAVNSRFWCGMVPFLSGASGWDCSVNFCGDGNARPTDLSILDTNCTSNSGKHSAAVAHRIKNAGQATS